MNAPQIIEYLKKNSNPRDREGMARFGINAKYALGVRVPVLRGLAKKIGRDHALARALWRTKIHEARILASMVDEPEKVTLTQADAWIKDFNSWDVCDQCSMNLFDRTNFAWTLPARWSKQQGEFQRRAGFAMMACLAWHDKSARDKDFQQFFQLIIKYATDERNYVKKAVNWALRQIGKRNAALRKQALATARRIQKINSSTAQWIANDAIRELTRIK